MSLRARLRTLIQSARPAGGRAFSVEVPARPEHGDYATNAVVGSPDSARAIAERLRADGQDLIAAAEVAGPGFINIRLADRALIAELARALDAHDRWGWSDAGQGTTVRVEYFQLNIAKRPHVGHLRSAVIGDAIKRMLLSQGYRAVSDTHVGDWGTQFGILLLAYQEYGGRERVAAGGDPFDALEELYVEENARIEADPIRRERAKEEFAKLERGDPENRRIWQQMVDVSMRKLEESASRLGLVPFDMHVGESFYEGMMPDIVALALNEGVAHRTPDGAVVADLSADGLDEGVLLKSDGASTYLLRDLATLRHMRSTLNFDRNLYVVDVRQAHYFRQLFRIAERLGFAGVAESVHIEFGFIVLPEGAMSTRKGTAISLDAVLDEAVRRARSVIAEKNSGLIDADTVAEQVGVGALKYFDLSHHRKSDIVFRWEEALSFDGNSGPYLQYTHARLRSILRKIAKETEGTNGTKVPTHAALDATEHRLLVSTLRFPEAIEDTLKDYTPNTLANYLCNLAKLANEFYHSHPVIQEPDVTKRELRLALVAGVAQTLKSGLYLLGIVAPEEM